ncbi:MAG: ABC transporter permease [Eubacteriales bacterium]|nr:ABC transporter permease [Eubacteriales bacterium]
MKIDHKKEPIIRISKRVGIQFWKSWLIRLAAIALSLCVCALLIFALSGLNPIKVFGTMAKGVFGTQRKLMNWVRDTSVLLCIAVGLAPAFKMRFWNIGAEGQMLVGGIAAAACMIHLGNLGMPNVVLLLIMASASIIAGGVWGVIPAISKAYLNTNETLFTLMMNYIAMQFLLFFTPIWEHPAGSNKVGIINSVTKVGWLSEDQKLATPLIMLFIVLIVTVLMFAYLKYSKQGYEIAVVGESQRTAKYAAINVKNVVVRSMTISGAICGLAGFLSVAGADHTISEDTAGGRGFIAIIVAWLAKFNTFVMILIAALIVFLDKGAIALASEYSNYNLTNDVADIITGIILFFILGSEFFINYKIKFHLGKGKEEIA